MSNLNDYKFNCSGCFLCKDICPKKAISIVEDNEGFFIAKIDKEKCINCGLCTKMCPNLNESINENCEKDVLTYAAYSNNKFYLKQSSSGGIFSEIANYFLNNGGVVYGASYESNIVKHIRIDNKNQLYKLRGSKYLQSNLDGVYKKINKDIINGKKVIFSGTPCQVAAINKFVKSKNLFTIDVVCHGVSPKKIFNIANKQRFKQMPKNVFFRDKSNGWRSYNIKYIFNNKIIKQRFDKDAWFLEYLKNTYLKKDCYNCKYANIPRVSDITLGDFWGIENIDKKFSKTNKNRGVSLVILNNNKGKKIFEIVKPNITCINTLLEGAIIYNKRINNGKYAKNQFKKRNDFFKKKKQIFLKTRSYNTICKLQTRKFIEKIKKYFRIAVKK